MVTVDWIKRIVGIIGSLGNLVWTSLLQSQRRIHHSVENVGARCEGRAIQSSVAGLFGLSSLSRLFCSLNQTNQRNPTDQINQLPATRRGMCDYKTWTHFLGAAMFIPGA